MNDRELLEAAASELHDARYAEGIAWSNKQSAMREYLRWPDGSKERVAAWQEWLRLRDTQYRWGATVDALQKQYDRQFAAMATKET